MCATNSVMSIFMFLLFELGVCVYVHKCTCTFVRVQRASIMYLDNATASLEKESMKAAGDAKGKTGAEQRPDQLPKQLSTSSK